MEASVSRNAIGGFSVAEAERLDLKILLCCDKQSETIASYFTRIDQEHMTDVLNKDIYTRNELR
jgi:hypothetical protein